MNQPRIARQKGHERPDTGRNLSKTLLVLGAVFVIWAGQAKAQESLGDLVAEGGFDWMIGRWVTTTDEGERLQLIYRWGLDKHLAIIQLKAPDYEYRGMVFYVPTEDKVVQVGVDNRGGTGKGVWEPDGNKAVVKINQK